MSSEFWDVRYNDEIYAYGREPNKYFKKFIDSQVPGKLLLPGEGEGRNAVYSASIGWEVTAIDQSIKGKLKTNQLAEKYKVSINYYTGDIQSFPFQPEEFDSIGLVFFHLPPSIRYTLHKQFIKALKPGGYMIIEAFSKDQLGRASGGPPALDLLYDRYILNQDFKTLEIMELYHTEEDLDEGPYHQGNAALVRMLARKI
jgi:SAM-dependent methyltransferase